MKRAYEVSRPRDRPSVGWMVGTCLSAFVAIGAAGCAGSPGVGAEDAGGRVMLSGAARGDFAGYSTSGHYRAFATSPGHGQSDVTWGYAYNASTVDRAVMEALNACKEGYGQVHVFGDCRLYAVGDIIVQGMSATEREAAMTFYRSNPKATTADLAKSKIAGGVGQ